MEKAPQHDKFNVFYKAFVHSIRYGKPWYEAQLSAETYAVVWWWVNDEKMPTFQTKSECQHAEMNVIDTLTKNIEIERKKPQYQNTKPIVKIKIIISFSPCAQCSDALIAFKESSDVKVELVFASLYNIKRASCCKSENICHGHLKRIEEKQSEDNKRGLKAMAAAYIGLRTFSLDDWKSLADVLNVSNVFEDITRQKEDERMAGDLLAILHPDTDLVDSLLGPLERTSLQDNPPTTSGAGGDRTSPDTTKGSLLKKRYRDETSPEQPQK